MLKLLDDSTRVFESHPGNLLILINYEGAFASPDYMKKAKEMSARVDHKVAKRAVIGLTEIQKILLNTFNRFAKGKATAFRSKEAALQFLVS